MADQQRDERDQAGAEQTVVIPTWKWPKIEPDAPTAPHPALTERNRPSTRGTPAAPSRPGAPGTAAERNGPGTPGAPAAPNRPGAAEPPRAARGAATAQPSRPAQPPAGLGQPSRSAQGSPLGQAHAGPNQPGDADTADTAVIAETVIIGDLPPAPPGEDGTGPAGDGQPKRDWEPLIRRAALIGAIAAGVLLLLYGVDLALASGKVPRGTTVAGVEVGGLDRAAAEQKLRDTLTPRFDRPVPVRAGDVDATVDPKAAGLTLDWQATLDRAGDQPLNPFTRLWSLFGSREVGTVSSADRPKLASAVEGLRATTDRNSTEGTVRFDGVTPVPVDPKPGQKLDATAAAAALTAHWADGRTVQLPVTATPARSTQDAVRAALEDVAQPAVSGPVRVTGEGGDATLTPDVIATALTFEVGQDGRLAPRYDNDKITEALRPQLAKTEKPGKDATVAIEGGAPVVKPSVDGRGVDWGKTLAPLPDVLRKSGDRSIPAVYEHQPAKFTTEQANGLGIREVIGEFTTRGFATDSGVNIRVIAAKVNGALIKPGETFSLNGYTGPRGTPQGYIEAGIIEQGRPGRAVGGGCSQFATTLFNASYFAGMTDVAHKEHSYYISRYPEGREATVFEGLIDLKFRNDAPTGALVETIWTPTSITVKIWGTKNYNVESITGGRSNFTEPTTVTIPPGEQCTPGNGAQGFTVSNTKVVRDARTGAELKRTTRTVVYNPVPKIICAPPGAPPPTPPPPSGG